MAEGSSDARSTRVATGIGTVVLALVVVAPAAASWHGLTSWGRDHGAAGVWAYLVPVVVDGAAAYAAWLALRDVLRGRSALVDRLLVWLYAVGSAALNAVHADAHGGAGSAAFFAGAAMSAALLWDRTLRHARWDQLDELGVLEPPLPRFRLLRWTLAPRETFGAWRLAVREGVSRPAEALARYRGEQLQSAPAPRATRRPSKPAAANRAASNAQLRNDASALPAAPAGELADMRKGEALVAAFAALGRVDVPAALAWLAERGVQMDRSSAYRVARRLQAETADAEVRPLTGLRESA